MTGVWRLVLLLLTVPTGASPLCSYSVTPIKFGFRIDFSNSPSGDYNLVMTEDGRPEIIVNLSVSNQISSHPIINLKPCTEYEHHVTFLHSDGNWTSCNSEYKTTTTAEMNGDEVTIDYNYETGHVCYQTEWDISSLQSTQSNISPQPRGNNTFCVKPAFDDICSNLIWTSENCVNSSFPLTNISAEFLNPKDINQIASNTFPAEIKVTLPLKCNNLSVDHTCRDGDNKLKTLSELEPFTDYTCTGHIKENNVPITNTSVLLFRVDCDLTITVTNTRPTNTSIELNWKTKIEKCNDDDLQNLSYICSCQPANSLPANRQQTTVRGTKVTSGGKCNISGLTPFTLYTCEVQAIYKGVTRQPVVKQGVQTEAGVPGKITSLTLHLQEHNVIKVTCDNSQQFNGPEEKYKAKLGYGSEVHHKTAWKKCEFVFDNLRYSTNYTVQVTAHNRYLETSPKFGSITTSYNDKAVIGFLIFLIVLTSVALLVVTYKIYVLKNKSAT